MGKLGLILSIALALIAALPVLSEEPVFAVASSGPKFSNQVDKLAESADASDSVTEFLRGHKKKDRKASKDSRHSSRRSSKKKKKKRSSRRSSKKSCKKSCKKKTKNVDCSRRC